MAVFKCKMCGGTLDITEGMTVCECEYCGSTQTVPQLDDEKKINLFTRANRLRLACEFDKAFGVYESIVSEFSEEAEAYWGLILCKYGIEYVDDPATGKKIPTCHRSSFDSVMDDPNFEMVMEYSDAVSRRVYRDEAKQIEELRKGIIEVSTKEEPYDIFICYKETDENGNRTIDSVVAQDIYKELTNEGYRVFFARISLEDKLGTAYEPYIFAALNSAKVMLAVGTDYDYYNAVWVKNEWSRFLALIAKGEKKTLIPCYKDIDAYDIPKEFKHLQAQDMGKVGAMQDLLRGVEKLLPKKQQNADSQSNNITNGSKNGSNIDSLLKRASIFLEDGEWNKAKEYYDKVLDANPEIAEAYIGLAMVKINCCNRKVFAEAYIKREGLNDISNEMRRAKQFADGDLKAWLGKLDEKKKSENKEKYLKLAKHRKYIAQFQGKILARESDTVGLKTDGTVVAVGQNYLHQCDVSDWTNIVSISGKKYHTVGLKSDGTVVAVGKNGDGQCNVSDWRDIVAVAASEFHTVGLKKDGTVVAVGSNLDSKCEVSGWKNIISVAVGGDTTFGLKSDGTVVAVGKNDEGQCEVSGWTDIVAIAASYSNTIGLKSDGTVVAAGRNNNGQCNVSGWTDIIAIVVTSFHTIGLRSDGTVVATGENEKGQCNVSRWTNIVSISSLFTHTVGLKSDGTVMATGSHKKNQCDVFGWKDIVSISAGLCHTVGLKSDGTVVAVGEKTTGQCNVSDWKLFKSESEKEADYNTACSLEESNSETQIIDAIGMFRGLNNYRDSSKRADECELRLQELRESLMEAERRKADCARQTRINNLNTEKNTLQTELSQLKGLFTGKRRKEIESRLAQIETELRKL